MSRMPHKPVKGISFNPEGRPPMYGQTKKRVNFTLTPEAVSRFDSLVLELKAPSRSEFLERLLRGKYIILPREELSTPDSNQI